MYSDWNCTGWTQQWDTSSYVYFFITQGCVSYSFEPQKHLDKRMGHCAVVKHLVKHAVNSKIFIWWAIQFQLIPFSKDSTKARRNRFWFDRVLAQETIWPVIRNSRIPLCSPFVSLRIMAVLVFSVRFWSLIWTRQEEHQKEPRQSSLFKQVKVFWNAECALNWLKQKIKYIKPVMRRFDSGLARKLVNLV